MARELEPKITKASRKKMEKEDVARVMRTHGGYAKGVFNNPDYRLTKAEIATKEELMRGRLSRVGGRTYFGGWGPGTGSIAKRLDSESEGSGESQEAPMAEDPSAGVDPRDSEGQGDPLVTSEVAEEGGEAGES